MSTTVGGSNVRRGRRLDNRTCPWGIVTPGAFCYPAARPHSNEVGQATARQMMMPPTPTAHFVSAHPQVLLAGLAAGLDRPAPPAQPHQRRQWRVGGGMTQRGLHLARQGGAPQDQPDLGAGPGLSHREDPPRRNAGHQGPWAPLRDRATPPAARGSTAAGAAAPASPRGRVGLRPCPDPAGTAVAGHWRQTGGSCGTSATYQRPRPSMWSSTRVSRPTASSQVTQRARHRRAWGPASLISPPHVGVVVNVRSAGTPHVQRRVA
jgi:hypothetical protein